MNYLDTAFGQLAFAWKLYNYGLEGRIDLAELDKSLTFQEGGMIFVLPDKILDSSDDLARISHSTSASILPKT